MAKVTLEVQTFPGYELNKENVDKLLEEASEAAHEGFRLNDMGDDKWSNIDYITTRTKFMEECMDTIQVCVNLMSTLFSEEKLQLNMAIVYEEIHFKNTVRRRYDEQQD